MLSQLRRLPCLSWLSQLPQLHVLAFRAVQVVPAAPAVLVALAVLARLDNDHDWISGSPGFSGHAKPSRSWFQHGFKIRQQMSTSKIWTKNSVKIYVTSVRSSFVMTKAVVTAYWPIHFQGFSAQCILKSWGTNVLSRLKWQMHFQAFSQTWGFKSRVTNTCWRGVWTMCFQDDSGKCVFKSLVSKARSSFQWEMQFQDLHDKCAFKRRDHIWRTQMTFKIWTGNACSTLAWTMCL